MGILAFLQKRGTFFWVTTGTLFVILLGIADYLTGNEFTFSIFYLVPIVLVTWFSGRKLGIAISLLSALSWYTAEYLAGSPYSQPWIRYWNVFARFTIFLIVTLLLPALKTLEVEKEIARTDYLTGAANRRMFFESVQREMNRARRNGSPFTIAYIDLDHFKLANDRFGHDTGDDILCRVVDQTKQHLRKTDIFARIGGDEFVLFLPDTDQHAAQIIVPKVRLSLMEEMLKSDWPVTFSIGVLTCSEASSNADELIQRADALMYSVKEAGKNNIAYGTYPGSI